MNVRNITTAATSLILIAVLSTGCRHHREVVYVNGTPPPANNTVVYNNTPPPVNNTVVYTNNQQQPTPPVVSIVTPVTNFASPGNYITVRGNVQNVLLAHQINVSQNGYPVRYFSYDPFNGNFHFQTFLQPGANNIIVTANNAYGTGSQGVTVFFNQPTGGGYVNGGNYPNNSINPNAINNNGGSNYPNNSINPNAVNNNGGNYPNNSINPNANVTPNGGNYPNNSINPNAVNNNNGGNYPNNSINPNANGGPRGGYNPNNNMGSPTIQYTNPSSTPAVVTVANYNVSALVQNVANANQITVNVNGSNIPSFNFNAYNHSLTFGVNLLTGFNSIHISASNGVGTASQSTVIDYKPTAAAPPRIVVFNPATSPFSSLQQNMIVSGYVYNVTSSSEISASFNGSPISFNYNQTTQEIEVPVNLTANSNQLTITANNPSGTDSKPVTLLLVTNNPHVGQQNPNIHSGGVIQIDQNNTINNTPHIGQQNPNIQTGGVTYIDQTNNGTNNTPHTGQQNPNLQTGGVTYIDQNMNGTNNTPHTGQQNPNLQTGGVTYIDQHLNTNTGGTATGQAGVHHAPEITRTSPASSPYTTMSGVISAAANVNGVTNSSEVSVTYNGSSVSFSYNPQISEALNFTSPLSPGMNTFVIRATNSYGTTTQDISVNYVPTNTSGNTNGNPNLHFASGTNVASNTPRELNTNSTPQRTEPIKVNTTKPVINNEKVEPKKK